MELVFKAVDYVTISMGIIAAVVGLWILLEGMLGEVKKQKPRKRVKRSSTRKPKAKKRNKAAKKAAK